MSKELDYINERIERLEFHIAHPNEYNITPTIKVKINDGAVYKEEVATLKRIKQQLEAIDNANPSEALEYLEQFLNEMTYCLEHPKEYAKGYERQIFWKFKNTLETTIKQALLKAQEPKHYLKWEDLEFNIEKQMMTVLLNGTKYTLIVGRNVHIDKLAFLRNGEINYYFLEADKQLFNDLHLERVEE